MQKLQFSKIGKGPNLVLLHGWGSSSKIWQTYINELSSKFQVWCIDLPGHGNNYTVKWDCSTEQGVKMLAQALPQTSVIVGWSLGGLLAQLFTKKFPHRVTDLMLIASAPKFVSSAQWPHGMQQNTFTKFAQRYTKAPQKTLQKFCALQVANTKLIKQDLSVLVDALPSQQRQPEKIQWGLQWLHEVDLRDDTTLGSFPITLWHGENDKVLSIGASKNTVSLWNNTKLERVANAGHAPFVSHPNRFLQWIDSCTKRK